MITRPFFVTTDADSITIVRFLVTTVTEWASQATGALKANSVKAIQQQYLFASCTKRFLRGNAHADEPCNQSTRLRCR